MKMQENFEVEPAQERSRIHWQVFHISTTELANASERVDTAKE